MKRIIAWLESLLSRWGAGADEPSDPESVRSGVDESTGEAANETHYRPAETNAPMPDIYAEEHDAPAPDRKFLDPSSPDTDKTTGFNPYDTARMHKK